MHEYPWSLYSLIIFYSTYYLPTYKSTENYNITVELQFFFNSQFLNVYIGVIRQDYLKKKCDSEKFELNLDLPSLDAEIKHYRKKLLKVTPKVGK